MRPFLIANFPRIVGGGEISLRDLVRGLNARGIKTLTGIPEPGGLSVEGDRVLLPRAVPMMAARIRQIAHSIDIIHATGPHSLTAAYLARTGKPILWHVRVAAPDRYDFLFKRFATVIVANSFATADRFRGSNKVRVVYNGIDIPVPAKTPLPKKGRKNIAVVGRWTEEKGIEDLVPAIRELSKEEIEFHFLGERREPIKSRVEKALGEQRKQCRFHEYVPNAAAHLGEFDMVVVPSRIEGFGRIAVEALVNGVPPVARPVGGLKEILEGLDALFLPEHPAEWTETIRHLLDNPPYDRRRLIARGKKFSLTRHVKNIIAVYRDLLKKRCHSYNLSISPEDNSIN
ncbi:MAG: glycosyltransferase [Candidatus Hydrogenedentota bacterium]|nr:MAG: glycosyltransferase [Candidatus Hydrogenedentota bacterium]